MSATTAMARPLHAPATPAAPRRSPHLQPVAAPARRRRPRILYAIVALAGALAIAAAQMGLSIAMTQGGYEERALLVQQRDLGWQKQAVTDELAGLSSPQYLAANAAALGMVINESPTYLRLSDGAVLGAGQAASWYSTVDPIGRGAVANSLVSEVPLVTEPDATMNGAIEQEADDAAGDTSPDRSGLPPALSDGLPTPETR